MTGSLDLECHLKCVAIDERVALVLRGLNRIYTTRAETPLQHLVFRLLLGPSMRLNLSGFQAVKGR